MQTVDPFTHPLADKLAEGWDEPRLPKLVVLAWVVIAIALAVIAWGTLMQLIYQF